MPSSTAAKISASIRSRIRLTTKPVASSTSTAFFLVILARLSAVATVSSSVDGVRTTSTNGITATGLKKWKPTSRSGCTRSAAISATDSEEVLVASTQL